MVASADLAGVAFHPKRIARPPARDDFLFFWTSELLAISGSEATLLKALNDSNADVRLAAVWALKRMASSHRSNIADRVEVLLKDRVAEVRVSAALTLGTIATNRVEIVPVLVDGLKDPSLREAVRENVKFGAPSVLARLGTNAQAAVPELRTRLRRQTGARGLKWLSTSHAFRSSWRRDLRSRFFAIRRARSEETQGRATQPGASRQSRRFPGRGLGFGQHPRWRCKPKSRSGLVALFNLTKSVPVAFKRCSDQVRVG